MERDWEKKKTRSHRCTCGRTFFHRISLQRHLTVSGCQAPEEDLASEDDHCVEPETTPALEAEVEDSGLVSGPGEVAVVPSGPTLGEALWTTACEFTLWSTEMVREGTADAWRLLGGGALEAGRWLTETALPVLREAAVRGAGILLVLGLGLLIVRPLFARQRGAESTAAPLVPAAHAMQPATPSGPSRAAPCEAVRDFYQHIDEGRLGQAYSRLSPEWQREFSFKAFEAGYSNTNGVRCRVLGARDLSPDRARVDVALDVLEGQGAVSYLGSYVVVRGQGGWVLDRGELTPTPG